MTGFKLSEIEGKNMRDVTKSGKQGSTLYKNMWDTILSGRIWQGELINKRKDGSLYDEDLMISPIMDDHGEVTHFVAVKQDSTKRKQMEVSIRESERRLKELTDFLPQTIYEIDTRGYLTFTNQSGLSMFRVTHEDVENGLNILDFVSREDRERARGDIMRALQIGKTTSGREYKMLRKDGSTFPANEYGTIIFKDGKIAGARGLIVDITLQKEAEQAVIYLKNRFETIFNTSRDAVVLLKGESIYDCNPATLGLFRREKEDLLGRTITELSPTYQYNGTLSKKSAKERIDRALSGESQFFEWQYRRVDGTLFDAEVSLGKIVLDDEEVGLAEIRDVTERKALEAQLRQAQKLESLGQLTSGIAHDFNNVLGGIIGFSELGLRKINDVNLVGKYLERINTLATRAAGITKQLLAFSRKQFLQPKNMNLNDLIVEFLQFLPRVIKESIQVRFIPDARIKNVYADDSQIEQVLINLAVNASDAMPNGGELVFRTKNVIVSDPVGPEVSELDGKRYVVLTVEDTGTGIDEEALEHIFEPFFTTKGVGKGTGLGLAVVHGIVKQHQGFVNVRSERGRGTTFEVYLPASDRESSVPACKPNEVISAKDPSEKVMIVEDDKELRELMNAVLSEIGYLVVDAENGEEALEIFHSEGEGVSLVISDVLMPRMSGKELYGRIRENKPGVRFLFVSGYAAEEGDDDFLSQTGINFIQKPFSTAEISAKVREILDRL